VTEPFAVTTSASDWRDWNGEGVTVREGCLWPAAGADHDAAESVGRAIHRYDAGTPGTEWHRLRVRTNRAAADGRVVVRYRAADDPLAGVDSADQSSLPNDQSSLSTDQSSPSTEQLPPLGLLSAVDGWSSLEVGDHDDHRVSATGRYLYVALELPGSSDAPPGVGSLRAFCGRESIGRHLPEIYDDSAFLDELLAVFETVFDDIEREIDGLTRYLDPASVPAESLSWLESWFGIEGVGEWPESARRELLARAPELYRKRGTRAGIRDLVGLYLRHSGGRTADSPTVFFLGPRELDRIERPAVRERVSAALPDGASVVCYHEPTPDGTGAEVIESLLDRESPAHVPTAAAALERSCSLDGTTFLGLNSALAPRQFRLAESRLHGESALNASAKADRPGNEPDDEAYSEPAARRERPNAGQTGTSR